MKRLNKKGFTLAELLIVIAIIAILIAIAIPVFGGQLDNARLQADHANIRTAYAIAQTATIQGGLYPDDGTTFKKNPVTGASGDVAAKDYYFKADGTIKTTSDAADYTLKATVKDSEMTAKCGSSAVCLAAGSTSTHKSGNKIKISFDETTATWKVTLVES